MHCDYACLLYLGETCRRHYILSCPLVCDVSIGSLHHHVYLHSCRRPQRRRRCPVLWRRRAASFTQTTGGLFTVLYGRKTLTSTSLDCLSVCVSECNASTHWTVGTDARASASVRSKLIKSLRASAWLCVAARPCLLDDCRTMGWPQPLPNEWSAIEGS